MPSTISTAAMATIASSPMTEKSSSFLLGRTILDRQQSFYESSTLASSPFTTIEHLMKTNEITIPNDLSTLRTKHIEGQPEMAAMSLSSFEDLASWTTDTRISALVHALLASFSVILVSELGDKTFIITAIMAMKNSRSLVFLSSASALLVMTILSVCMGVAATVIPEVYTHYAAIVLFICFGFKMLKESWDMRKCNSNDESEFEEVERSLEVGDEKNDTDLKVSKSEELLDKSQEPSNQSINKSKQIYEKIVKTLYIAPIVIKVFTMIFVAEWGDRSQISTVILAARENSIGVFIGSLSGHIFCTGLAVIGGRFVADMISVRTMTLLGGIIFLFFAVFAILTGPDMS